MKLRELFKDLQQSDIDTIEQSPGILIFLPMLYVAWSDSVLSEQEIISIKQKVSQQDWLSDSERAMVVQRLNPEEPPTPQQLHDWLAVMKIAAPLIPSNSRQSLAALGLEITRLADQAHEEWQSEKAQDALIEIEDALGVIATEAMEGLVQIPGAATDQPVVDQSFDLEDLKILLGGPSAQIRYQLFDELNHEEFQVALPSQTHDYRELVYQWCQTLAARGYGALSYPKVYGGGEHMEEYFTVMETLSFFDLSLVVKYGVQFGLFGGSILALGTEKHHRKYLSAVGSLKLPGCFAMTERAHGSNVRDIETTAIYDANSGEFVINTPHAQARKDYIGNAALHGQMATVFAQLYLGSECHGVSAFLVPIRSPQGELLPGITIEDCGHKIGLNGVDNGRIHFDQVRIPYDNLLDRFAQVKQGAYRSPISSDSKRFFTMLGTLVGGRIGIPRSALSAAKKGLALAIRYAHKRRQFGQQGQSEQLIMDYQSHQKRLMPLLATTYALDFTLKELSRQYIELSGDHSREIEALAAGIKAYTTWFTTSTLQTCREACGGNGYLSDNFLGSLKADTEIFTTFEGDNTVLMQLVAKSRLADFKQEFHEIKFLGLVKYIAQQAATSLTEMNPIVTRKTAEGHLRDHDFQLAALSYREQHLLKRAAQRLKSRIDGGMNSFEAFNECQNHLIVLAHAYIERVILEHFIAVVEQTPQEGLKAKLSTLASLFALNTINQQNGWYQENGYLEASKSKAIRRQVTVLCKEVRADSLTLVNAFGIPDHLLKAPMLEDD